MQCIAPAGLALTSSRPRRRGVSKPETSRYLLREVLEAMMPYLTTEWGNRRAERRSAWASAAGPYGTRPLCATEAIEVYSRQLTFETFSIFTVNCRPWTANSSPCRTRGAPFRSF